jgi:hypothetical protein
LGFLEMKITMMIKNKRVGGGGGRGKGLICGN